MEEIMAQLDEHIKEGGNPLHYNKVWGKIEKWSLKYAPKESPIYVLPDTAITEFAQKTAKETNVEKIEALLMEFVQEHFQFRVEG